MLWSYCLCVCVCVVIWVLRPSSLFHSFWAESIARWGENGRSPRKTTWPPFVVTCFRQCLTTRKQNLACLTWSHMWPELCSNPQRCGHFVHVLKYRQYSQKLNGVNLYYYYYYHHFSFIYLCFILQNTTILKRSLLREEKKKNHWLWFQKQDSFINNESSLV